MAPTSLGLLAFVGVPFALSIPFAQGAITQACTETAEAALQACRNEASGDYWITLGNCRNLKGPQARDDCKGDAGEARSEALEECDVQHQARLGLCGELGESPYHPVIDPSQFVDPREIGRSVAPNPYLMLVPGRAMIYRNGDERIVTTVTTKIVKILGVDCVEIHDVSLEEGVPLEDTFDWLAQDIHGNVWYFGELSKAFENGRLASLEGSWKAGEDFARPGIIMEAAPAVGDVYRQEFALGSAEDAARVRSLAASASVPAATCRNNCLLTQDFTPIEPDVLERKYYAPGVGLILTTEAGEREELIEVRP